MCPAYFAPCTLGVEPALEGELAALGATDVTSRRGGVAFAGDVALGYAANLWLRSAIRVQEVLLETEVGGEAAFYDAITALPWERWLDVDGTLAVDASVRDSFLTHSGYAAQRAKDAIVDRFRDRFGKRPSVDTRRPDLPLKLVLHGRRLSLARNLSGASLHKRGYRPIQVKSPLNEATAAGLLLLTGWDGTSPLVDPMCGSGTFLIEAALLATDRAPGLARAFAFTRWLDHDDALWQELRAEARARIRSAAPAPLLGADRHAGAIGIARKAAYTAGVEALIDWHVADVAEWQPRVAPGMVVVNPPYGERLGEGDDLAESWHTLGRFFKERCSGAEAWVLSGNPELTPLLRLKTSRRIVVHNGPIECRWLRYEIRERRAPSATTQGSPWPTGDPPTGGSRPTGQ